MNDDNLFHNHMKHYERMIYEKGEIIHRNSVSMRHIRNLAEIAYYSNDKIRIKRILALLTYISNRNNTRKET